MDTWLAPVLVLFTPQGSCSGLSFDRSRPRGVPPSLHAVGWCWLREERSCTALRLETTIHDRNGKAARTRRGSRPHPGPGRRIEHLVQADATAQGRPRQPHAHPHAHGGALRSGDPDQPGEPAHRAADRPRALQVRARHQGRFLHQVLRRPEADLRQVDDHQRRRALAEDPHAAAAGVPPRHVRRVHPLLPRRHPHQDGHLGASREVGRDDRDGGADLDARRRHDLQGAVRPRHAVQSALRVQVREDLHRRDEPQGDPLEASGGRGVRDHGGGRRQGHGGVGERSPGRIRRQPARGARAHAPEDDRGGGRRSRPCPSSTSSRRSTN